MLTKQDFLQKIEAMSEREKQNLYKLLQSNGVAKVKVKKGRVVEVSL